MYRSVKFLSSYLALSIISAPAYSIQIGPEIRMGPGEVTIGGAGVRDGKVVAPTPDEMLDTVINSTPLAVLSDADKNNVKQAIVTTGYAAAILSDPVTSIVIISVMSKDGSKDVPVPVKEALPTGKEWAFSAKCIVQQPGGLITAFFVDDPAQLNDIANGDKIILSAAVCPEYKEKSVTAVTIKFTGRSDFPDAKEGEYKHYIVGRTT
ncbi:hypothetical protein [Rhizobium leguminosarum]|uniref:hypothetical protein n=1 Tax=Rhizobium leguminosarum TaxID=384 RepID=UPI00036AD1F3|nr:hypothetical protein [Rhizobium leguminosarum]